MDETTEVERMLEPLIREHGLEKVQDDLRRLMPRSNWPSWQRVNNLAANVARRLERDALQPQLNQ